MHRLLFAVVLLSILTGAVATAQQLPPRPLAQNLPEAHARARAALIDKLRYTLEFRLNASAAEYAGHVSAMFDLASGDTNLTLDFDAGSIESVEVNGVAATVDYNGHYLTVPAALLATGANRIDVSFSRAYSGDGSGLYRFIDPEDERAYLYTDFEPFDQNRLFPSFDQPDLKARFTTTVRAPADWMVVANTRETAVEAAGDERIWHFPETAPISTYVYALHAGEYRVWESRAGEIPLRLLARQSLARYVYTDHWFDPTVQGFEFFQSYFETPYPFGKYDQIIVPHFNAGAMENVGAVTFSERYLRRGGVTRQNRRAIASVVLHEMAHMWFGNLVTMDWWNGLWLNESFATVMAVIAMTEATEFDDEWQESYLDTVRAYRADERDTTHPIELPVPDTDDAFANFDRITYQKGSAVLVQLMHRVGPENFRRGVADYLRQHAYGNTSIDDFLTAISRAADLPLDQWAENWLLTPGTNTVEVELDCHNGRIERLAVIQTAPARWPTLRTHRTQLGLYRFTDGHVEIDTVPLTYSGTRTEVSAAESRRCPDLVYPNHGDWDFVRVRLDPSTIEMLDGRLAMIEDPLTRLMLWQSVWDAVLDARMPLTGYIDFALANHPAETNEAALRQVLSTLSSASDYVQHVVADMATSSGYQRSIDNYLWQRTIDAEPGSDRQLLFYDTYVGAAATPTAIGRIADLLTGATFPPDGLNIDPDRRWNAIATLARAGHPATARLNDAQAAVDTTEEGRLRTAAIAASRPEAGVKSAALDRLLDPNAIATLAEFRAIARSLFPRGQHELQAEFATAAFDGLAIVNASRDAAFFSSYTSGLLGALCTENYRDRLDRALETDTVWHPLIVKALLDSRFETNRCLRMRNVLSPSESG